MNQKILRTKPTRLALSLMITAFPILFMGCFFLPEEEAVLSPPIKEPPTVTYQTVTAKKGILERKLSVTGYVRLMETEDLSFKGKDGRVKYVYKGIGDEVKKGELLIELESDTSWDDIKKTEIEVKKAELELENSRRLKESELALADLELSELKKRYDIIIKLPQSYSEEEINEQKRQIRIKEIQNTSLTDTWNYNIERELLGLEEANLNLEIMESELEKTRLVSPISGDITYFSDLKIGDAVSRDVTLVRVSSPSKKLIQYSGDMAVNLVKGMHVNVTVKGEEYTGEVVMSVGDIPDDAPESFKTSAYISVPEIQEEISEGDTAQIEAIFESRENVLILPVNSLKMKDGQYVVTVLKDDVKYERNIEVGMKLPAQVEVTAGLEDGEIVVIR